LRAELNTVLDELSPLLVQSDDLENVEAEIFDAESVREILEELEPLLKSGNTECLKYIDVLRPLPGSGQLIRQLEDFDFDVATVTLAKLKELGMEQWTSR